MTIIQKQCLLRFLNHYTAEVDGIWGSASRDATRRFQKAAQIEADGVFGPETEAAILRAVAQPQAEDFWQNVRFFRQEEFACRCGSCGGFPAQVQPLLLAEADALRAHFDAPVTITSGVRCESHNAAVGGVANSRHLYGCAMDFSVEGQSAEGVLAYLRRRSAIRYAYAIDSRHVHMDIGEGREPE